MRASVQFQIQISYTDPARGLNQALRLTPRGFDGQEIKDWRVDVEPDARMRRSEDPFGNIVLSCSHDGPLDGLTITAEGEIETNDVAGVVRGLPEKMPLDVYLRETEATHADADLIAFAEEALADEKDPLGRFHALMAAFKKAISFTPGEETEPRAASAVLAARSGTAREIAQLFVAASRSQGAPARFVSGFFLGEGSDAHHAWAEVHVEPIGWIGFDAALGLCPRDEHLRIAHGLDYFGAAPRRASCLGYAREDATSALSVDIGRQASWQVQQ
jgi:transglutaminase-like putative cysteine protease